MSRAIKWIAAALLCLAVVEAPADELKVVYFGNSFLENSVPWFHPTLFATAGKQVKVQTALGPGWQIWMHVDAMRRNPDGHPRKLLVSGEWNAVVIQHFGTHPGLKDNVRKSVFLNQEFDEPRDVSDLASASEIIDLLLAFAKKPEQVRVFIYNSWPGIPGVAELQKRIREEAEKSFQEAGRSREEILKALNERKPTPEEMDPLVRKFNYAEHWLGRYEWNPEVPWASKNAHSRDYVRQLMEALWAKYPELARTGRLRLIPNGEVFLALDRKARAGQLPGIDNVGRFYTDGGHARAGLPRFTLAATCYAVMFGEHPGRLDPAIYNDKENYRNERLPQPGYVHWPDLGELIEITPERKKIVADTIWEVVCENRYTRVCPRERP
ncbi:MAG: hypothetical protein ACUVQG_11480 [Thermogutta sp.]